MTSAKTQFKYVFSGSYNGFSRQASMNFNEDHSSKVCFGITAALAVVICLCLHVGLSDCAASAEYSDSLHGDRGSQT